MMRQLKRAALFWLLPLVVFVLPWAGPALQGHRRLAWLCALAWLVSVLVMLLKWAGPGLLAWVGLGLISVMFCRVPADNV
jgi:hypothetical protein